VPAVSVLREKRRACLNESSYSVAALQSSEGDRSSRFVSPEGRIMLPEGQRRREVVGRVALLLIPPQSSFVFVDNTFVQ